MLAGGFYLRTSNEVSIQDVSPACRHLHAWDLLPGWLTQRAWQLVLAVNRRPQFLATSPPHGLPECLYNRAAGFSQSESSKREREKLGGHLWFGLRNDMVSLLPCHIGYAGQP